MEPFVIFVCLLIANSSSEYATKSKFSEEPFIENLKNSIDISSSNRTGGNSKDIFQKILPSLRLMSSRRVRLLFTPTSFWLILRRLSTIQIITIDKLDCRVAVNQI